MSYRETNDAKISDTPMRQRLQCLIGRQVRVVFHDSNAWTGMLKEIGLDFIRVEGADDGLTLVSLPHVRRITATPENPPTGVRKGPL